MKGRSRPELCFLLSAVTGIYALVGGCSSSGADWHVYGDETPRTTQSQESRAMSCAPTGSEITVLESDPGEIDIHFHGSAEAAHRIANCLRQSAGIREAGAVRSQ